MKKAQSGTVELARYDASEFLDSEEVIVEYLAAALEDPNPDTFLRAMAKVEGSRGISGRERAPERSFRKSERAYPKV